MRLSTRLTSIRNSELFFMALGLMVVSIPLSRWGMSVAQLTLLGLWFWHLTDHSYLRKYTPADLLQPAAFIGFLRDSLTQMYASFILKLKLFSQNKAALVLTSLYLLHIAGLLYTNNFEHVVRDLRIKMPLFILPLILSTGPKPSLKLQRSLLLVFVGAVFAGTIISAYILFTRIITDPRYISVFIWHVRFSLCICFSVFILAYFVAKNTFEKPWITIIFCALICWFLVFLVFMQSGTGILITALLVPAILIYYVLMSRQLGMKLLLTGLILLLPLSGFLYVYNTANTYSSAKPLILNTLEKHSTQGTVYIHDTVNYGIENGQYIGIYLAIPELRTAWNERSNLDFDGSDKQGQEIRITLIRFLNSKGFRKDADGVKRLTSLEVQFIEQGVANVDYLKRFSVKSMIYQFMLGYRNYLDTGNPNASSAMQRLEYWRASLMVIQQHWLTGVGTGDVMDALTQQYDVMNSQLVPTLRWRSHNQYLLIFLTFGVFGFILFIVTLIYPAVVTGRFHNYFYVIFLLIILISMITDDTLELQDGVTFYAFFNAFLLFSGDEAPKAE